MRKNAVVAAVMTLCLCVCFLGLTACGSDPDKDGIKGQWQVKDTKVVDVFTDSEFKTSAGTWTYTMDTGNKTITFTKDGKASDPAAYQFSEDRKELVLKQKDDSGNETSATFEKISDDSSAQPSVNGVASDGSGE